MEKDETIEDHPFKEGKRQSNIVLVVGDQRFHVNKSVLMVASPVFEKMFNGDYKEKDATEIELKQEDPEEFLMFLKCLYPGVNEQLTAKTALAVAKVADKYQVEALLEECDTILAKHCKMINVGGVREYPSIVVIYIEAAEKYGLKKLLPVSISSAVVLQSGEIKESQISKETQLEIFRRRVESFEKLMSDFDHADTDYFHRKELVYDLYKTYKKETTFSHNCTF